MSAETIVTEMLNPDARQEEVGQYQNWLRTEGYAVNNAHLRAVVGGVKDSIYGIAVASNLRFFRTAHHSARTEHVPHIIDTLLTLTHASEMDYRTDKYERRPKGWYRSGEFREEVAALHDAIAIGKPDASIMSHPMIITEGIQQVERADSVLGSPAAASIGAQRHLADANYATTFSNRTMLSAAAFPDTTPKGIAKMTGNEQMPWLTKTNVASALVAKAVVQAARKDKGTIDIFDAGSGTGATLAAFVAALGGRSAGNDLSHVSITAMESNPQFLPLLTHFAPTAAAQLATRKHGPFGVQDYITHSTSADVRNIGIMEGDVVGALQAIPLAEHPKDITVVVENYVFHRVPSVDKLKIFQWLSQASNSLFLFGDLARNGSYINRAYFNFTNNGPLNTGNRGLLHLLNGQGFTVLPTHESIPRELQAAIAAEQENDCIAGIAFRGSYIGGLLAGAA